MLAALEGLKAMLEDPTLSSENKMRTAMALYEISKFVTDYSRQIQGSQQSRFVNFKHPQGVWLAHQASGFPKCANG